MEPEEVAEAFLQLQNEGKVRQFGVSNFNPAQVDLLQQAVPQRLIINQLQFSLMHTGMIDAGMHTNMADARSIDHDGGLLPYSQQHHMTIQAWSPFQYGFFEGVFINNDQFPKLNALLQKLADQYTTNLMPSRLLGFCAFQRMCRSSPAPPNRRVCGRLLRQQTSP